MKTIGPVNGVHGVFVFLQHTTYLFDVEVFLNFNLWTVAEAKDVPVAGGSE